MITVVAMTLEIRRMVWSFQSIGYESDPFTTITTTTTITKNSTRVVIVAIVATERVRRAYRLFGDPRSGVLRYGKRPSNAFASRYAPSVNARVPEGASAGPQPNAPGNA